MLEPPGLPPDRIETSRLVLRPLGPEHAHLLREAIDTSLDHLREWLPWALSEPRSLDETRAHVAKALRRFRGGEDFQYAVLDGADSRVLGGAGLHRRSSADCLEIGYWIRVDSIGRGYASEAAAALCRAGLRIPGIEWIHIDCDPNNVRSVRVPERLGFELLERRKGNKRTPDGEPRDTLVFEAGRDWLTRWPG